MQYARSKNLFNQSNFSYFMSSDDAEYGSSNHSSIHYQNSKFQSSAQNNHCSKDQVENQF